MEVSYRTSSPYHLQFRPLVLKRLVLGAGINQSEIARHMGRSRALVNLCINRGLIPPTLPDFREKMEAYLLGQQQAREWLAANDLTISDIWRVDGAALRNGQPAGAIRRSCETRKRPPLLPGDPREFVASQHIKEEDFMLSEQARKHFKLFRHPFLNDMDGREDTFMSEDHRYILEVMDFAANHGGMVAVIGEVGSGKTAMRRQLEARLRRQGDVRIVFPRIIDKSRATASSLCDAIIMDLKEGMTPKLKLEAKSRQVEKLLHEHCNAGKKVAMIIEEAQDLAANDKTIKMLKRFNEIEYEGRKTIGIILIGQSELQSVFDESINYHMREVIRRFEVALIRGLNGDLKDYLQFKLKRVGVDIKTIITDEAIKALGARLTAKEERRKVSFAYPLTVNRWMVRAMNEAAELGEKIVTPEIVNALPGVEAL